MKIVSMKIKDGKIAIEVDGCVGESCRNITEKIEEALGTRTGSNEKPELFQESQEQAFQ